MVIMSHLDGIAQQGFRREAGSYIFSVVTTFSRAQLVCFLPSANYIVVLLLVLLSSGTVNAASSLSDTPPKPFITIYADDWEDYSGRDGRGLYFDIVREAFEPLPVEVEFVYQPIRRGIGLLKRGDGDAVLGLWHHRHSSSGQEYLTGGLPIDVEIVSAVFPKSSDWDWQRLSTEPNARYAWVKGYEYGIELNLPRQARVPASLNGLRMLRQNHIDGFIDDQFYVSKVLDKSPNFELNDFRIEPILIRNMYVAFRNTEDGARWLRLYQQQMQRLLKEGRLHALFQRWELDYEAVKYRDPERY